MHLRFMNVIFYDLFCGKGSLSEEVKTVLSYGIMAAA